MVEALGWSHVIRLKKNCRKYDLVNPLTSETSPATYLKRVTMAERMSALGECLRVNTVKTIVAKEQKAKLSYSKGHRNV